MNFVSGNKIGKVLNVMINGNTYTKKFDTDKDALDAFKKVISTSENPTDDAIKALKHMLVKPVNVPLNRLISVDKMTDKYYFKDTNFELPKELAEVINDYIDNGLPLESIENFTELLVTNVNKEVHADLFNFLSTYHFTQGSNTFILDGFHLGDSIIDINEL